MTLRGLSLIIAVILTLSLFPGCGDKPEPVSAVEQSKPKSGSINIEIFDQTEENPANNLEIVFGNGIKMRPKEKETATQVPLFQLNEWHSITVFIDGENEYAAEFYLSEEDGDSVSVLIEDDMVAIISGYIEGGGVAYERLPEEYGDVA